MHILLLSRYGRLGASSRVRYYQFIPTLEALGHTVTTSEFLPDAYLRRLYQGARPRLDIVATAYLRRIRRLLTGHADIDLIWMEKEALPWMPAWFERWLRRSHAPLVVDYDDAVYHSYQQHRLGLVRTMLGTKIEEVMREACLVVAGNDYIADHARRSGARRVEILPTVVDTSRYRPIGDHQGSGRRIGWIGSPLTSAYLEQIRAPLTELVRVHRAELVLIGARPGTLSHLAPRYVPWHEDAEVDALNACEVGIMPLPDSPFERGKCGYKLIQFMACEKAVVGSPVGVNRQIIRHGENGLLASTEREWSEALARLIREPEVRRRLATAGRTTVEREFSTAAIAPRLAALLASVHRRRANN